MTSPLEIMQRITERIMAFRQRALKKINLNLNYSVIQRENKKISNAFRISKRHHQTKIIFLMVVL